MEFFFVGERKLLKFKLLNCDKNAEWEKTKGCIALEFETFKIQTK